MTSSAPQTSALIPLVVPGPYTSVIHRWKDVAHACADRPALSSDGVSYTFAEADALSDAVAITVSREAPADDSPIGAFVSHTAAGLIAYLAIVKTGRIVVVLDSHVPTERLRGICDLAGITCCVADAANLASARALGDFMATVIPLEEAMESAQQPELRSAADNAVLAAGMARGGKDPISIVFTSGSTGRPKGVVQTHNEILNDVMTSAESFRITPDDRVAMVLPYGFAAGSILQFVALLSGAGLWSFDPRNGGVRSLIGWIEDNHLTTLNCTPHLLRSLVAALGSGSVLSSLRMVSTVGEAVHGHDVEAIRPHLVASATFFNWVGSSEMGTLSMFEIPGDAPVPPGTVPAGVIVSNKEVILLREDMSIAGDGEVGEIVAISDYLSGEYWQDDASNALRFSFHTDGRRLCRQGDLGRFDENGNLVLLGRADAAVKVRGYLVEPSEIEAAFLAIDGVTESVVLTVSEPPTPTRLIAYVVQDAALRPHSAAALRRLLRVRLPEYMVPAAIIQLSALPRNERGKVDRALLPPVPAPTLSSEPMNPRELVLADIWSEVLGLEFVGLDDDFMALGGDSLSAEELLAIVRERFGVSMVSTDLLEAPTLREFSARVQLGTSALPTHPDVVTLNSGGIRTPVFCFAGAGALALTFLPLSRHFAEHSMYAFQAHGLETRGLPDWSVESAARRFLEIMRIIQPRGPYLLVGHSYGGLIALEIVRQLTAAGEAVEMVTLLDTYLPQSADALRPVMQFEKLPDRKAPATRIRRGTAAVQQGIDRILPSGIPIAREWGRHLRARAAGVLAFSGQRQFDAFFDHGNLAARKYQITPYDGRVLFVLADGNPDGRSAWQALLTGSLEFVEINGEHSSLLREPHVTALADSIQTELDRIEQ